MDWFDDPERAPVVRLSNRTLRLMRIQAARKLARHTDCEWALLQALCGHRCVRCSDQDEPTVKDHIVPIYLGGSDGIHNLQPLCARCNASKGAEDIDHRPIVARAALGLP